MSNSVETYGEPPVPEFVTAATSWGSAYGWRCDAHGITTMGDTKAEALSKWRSAYSDEYGSHFIEQGNLFAAAATEGASI